MKQVYKRVDNSLPKLLETLIVEARQRGNKTKIVTIDVYYGQDVGLDLYDQEATIEFGWRLRDTLKFDGLDPLLEQMAKDCQRARELTEK